MVDFSKMSEKAREFYRREEAVLQAALKLFLLHGEDKVTVEMIADEAGIGKGTIYKHFQSKSEIYLTLMIRYEEELAELFQRIHPEDNADRLARDYFHFRMQDPDRYALFDRLEAKCTAEHAVPELMEKLHRIRVSNTDKLVEIVQARISEGRLADVPPYFHICAAWALVHGAVALRHSDFYNRVIEDEKDAFFEFLMDISVRMGNVNRHRK